MNTKIEYVLRVDRHVMPTEHGKYVDYITGTGAFKYKASDLQKAKRFSSAEDAATALKRRQASPYVPTATFSIVPVKVTITPGVKTVKRRTVALDFGMKYYVENGVVYTQHGTYSSWNDGTLADLATNNPARKIAAIVDLLQNPTEIIESPASTTVELA